MALVPESPRMLPSGIDGLDELLGGGLPQGGLYLLTGEPGSGKTTFSMQFLRTGVAAGQRALLIALSETYAELAAFAASHGWSLDGIDVMHLSDLVQIIGDNGQQTLFHTADVEFAELTDRIRARIATVRPERMVIDSLSELRHLAGEPSRFRLHLEVLKPSLAQVGCTALLVDDGRTETAGGSIRTFVHGVVALDYQCPEFGPYRRRLRIQKMRNLAFREGLHDFEIQTGGLVVFPRVTAGGVGAQRIGNAAPSGLAALDSLLDGGIDRGTSTLLMGPAGSGKSSLAVQFVWAALQRGERAAIYLFDEHLPTLLKRSAGMGNDVGPAAAEGRLELRQVNPLELSPGKFSQIVRTAVDGGAGLVVIDSLSGYIASMGEELHLDLQLRDLLAYLASREVSTLLVSVQHGLLHPAETASGRISYLADNVILLRFYEQAGEVRRALSVVKRRAGLHETTIRDLTFSSTGLTLSEPLRQFTGVLTGLPAFEPAETTG